MYTGQHFDNKKFLKYINFTREPLIFRSGIKPKHITSLLALKVYILVRTVSEINEATNFNLVHYKL